MSLLLKTMTGKVKQFIIEYHYSIHKQPRILEDCIQLFQNHSYRVDAKVLFPENPCSDFLLNIVRNYD